MLETIREGEKTTKQRGLLWAGMWKRQNTARGENKGNIDSVAATTVLAGDQVKEGDRAPTDCSRKTKEQTKKGERGIQED